MLHRRTINDDSLGVGEPLSETAFGQGLVVRGRHSLVVQPPETSAQYHRVAAQQMFMHPLAFYSIPTESYNDYTTHFRQTWSALAAPLPVNVHLLTLDQIDAKNYIVRLEHFFELNEDATYSHPVTVDLQTVFQAIGTISTTVEYNLSANIPLSEVKRLQWTTSDGESSQTDVPSKLSMLRLSSFICLLFFYCRRKRIERHYYHFESNANPYFSSYNQLNTRIRTTNILLSFTFILFNCPSCLDNQ